MSVIIDGSNGITTPDVLSNQDALGYTTGAGGTVTQLTSKATAVTLNKPTGQITTAADALAASAAANFFVNNSFVQATDVVIVTNNKNSNYRVQIVTTSAGGFTVSLKNESGGSLSEAVTINFAIIKGATS